MHHYALTTISGGSALSGFRARALLSRLQAVVPRVTAVTARYEHWVASDSPLDDRATETLQALLTYGDPAPTERHDAAGTALVVVTPRLGTISPWASKATDIVHNCGIDIHRVERVTAYTLGLEGPEGL
ncbi:MAG TPA: hypothetical protein VK045_09795, partial [Ornithinicoccus sp.]|nr:hypothetical protein [Ornithinicoccus sp.]